MKRYFIKWFSFLFSHPRVKPSKTYEAVRRFLDNVPNINYGGCGISALVLFDHARAEGKKPKIVFGYSAWGGGYDENQEYKKGNRPHAESASHIFIQMEGKDYDSEGEYERKDRWNFDSEITREHLVDAIKHGSWNDSFRRAEWLPRIEKFIGYKLV